MMSASPPTQAAVLRQGQRSFSSDLEELLTSCKLGGLEGPLEASGLTSINRISKELRCSKDDMFALLLEHGALYAEVVFLSTAIDCLVDAQ